MAWGTPGLCEQAWPHLGGSLVSILAGDGLPFGHLRGSEELLKVIVGCSSIEHKGGSKHVAQNATPWVRSSKSLTRHSSACGGPSMPGEAPEVRHPALLCVTSAFEFQAPRSRGSRAWLACMQHPSNSVNRSWQYCASWVPTLLGKLAPLQASWSTTCVQELGLHGSALRVDAQAARQ